MKQCQYVRGFQFARKKIDEPENNNNKQFADAQLPEYQTKGAAAADFFAADDVEIPSIWLSVMQFFKHGGFLNDVTPTLVHTGVKAFMADDEVLEICNRSSGPKKKGLVLANSIGIIDSDYYNNKDNDGEIMFAFYNFKFSSITIHKGDRIGQGMFKKVLRAQAGLRTKDVERVSGFGSTETTK